MVSPVINSFRHLCTVKLNLYLFNFYKEITNVPMKTKSFGTFLGEIVDNTSDTSFNEYKLYKL